MHVIYTCKTKNESRAVEQITLATCITAKFTEIAFGVAPSNKIRGVASNSAEDLLGKLENIEHTFQLLGCTPDSDLLLQMNM